MPPTDCTLVNMTCRNRKDVIKAVFNRGENPPNYNTTLLDPVKDIIDRASVGGSKANTNIVRKIT